MKLILVSILALAFSTPTFAKPHDRYNDALRLTQQFFSGTQVKVESGGAEHLYMLGALKAIDAQFPELEEIYPSDPMAIGASHFLTVRNESRVTKLSALHFFYSMGWGDCPAGCISHHTWEVEASSQDGGKTFAVKMVNESGSPLPANGRDFN